MHPRNFVFITLMTLCHLQLASQMLTNPLPPPQQRSETQNSAQQPASSALPDDPGQEAIPLATPEPNPPTGVPLRWEAGVQTWQGETATLSGGVIIYYRDYIIHADRVTYNRATTEMHAEGNLKLTGGSSDAYIAASHGDLRLDMHTARFYDVNGSIGLRRSGRTVVYSTANPFLFSARVLLQSGEDSFKIIAGTMTISRIPKPDWQVIARSITVANDKATTRNSYFKLLGVPTLYLPYLSHPVVLTGRQSGLLIPVISNSTF